VISYNDEEGWGLGMLERLKLRKHKGKFDGLYVLILVLLFLVNRIPGNHIALVKGLLILALWLIPFFMHLQLKIINTLVLSVSIYAISHSFFNNSVGTITLVSVIITMMLYVALIMNIFVVIKEMYEKSVESDQITNGMKFGYILFAFGVLVSTVLMTYSLIYDNLYLMDAGAFLVNSSSQFDALYYSFVTYFTVGYGDITPVTTMAKGVSLSQMVLGYIITCLVIPVILVAIQKLIDSLVINR